MAEPSRGTPFLAAETARLLAEYLRKIDYCVALLAPAEVWWRPNPTCNTVGNLLLHLCGNISQRLVAGLGGADYERRRREEFAAAGGEDGPALVARLREVVTTAREVAQGLTEEDLRRDYTIQGVTRSGAGTLLHVLEHTAYHTGQIVYVAKQLVGDRAEIEFYPHLK